MIFRTIVPLSKYPFQITHKDSILNMGSCFVENIGEYLEDAKFNIQINPFGITYNPVTIANQLSLLLTKKEFEEKDLFQYNQLWNSWLHHSRYSNLDKEACLENINIDFHKAQKWLRNSKLLIITLGTAYAFEYLKTEELVANCHKLPAKEFKRFRLTKEMIKDNLLDVFPAIKKVNPQLQILLTISPVRHLKDGLHENQLSKANLLLAVEEVCKSLTYAHYFPAYELFMDDLRDYRFCEADMTHPNQQAINYIWNYFTRSFFSESTTQLLKKIHQIKQSYRHRSFQPNSEIHQLFLQKQLKKITSLLIKHPYLDFQKEQEHFSKGLKY